MKTPEHFAPLLPRALAAGAFVLALLIGLFAIALAADAMLLAMVATAAEGPSATPERYTLEGGDVVIYDLAGKVRLGPGDGHQVVVLVSRGGRDASQMRIVTGPLAGAQTLRVMVPGTRVVYPELGYGGSTNFRVRGDGTFGNRDTKFSFGTYRNVTIAGSGSGTEAYADLRVEIPRGQHLTLHLAAGTAEATNVDGRIELDAEAADVSASGARGDLAIDTGSGAIEVTGAEARVTLDTGSGDIRVSKIHGTLSMDTGSGRIEGSGIDVDHLSADTGSGDIELSGVIAPILAIDTGSGSVTLALDADVSEVSVDTGSGNITLRLPESLGARLTAETSSGGIRSEIPLQLTRHDGGSFEGTIGDGRGRIALETGSGSVRLLAQK
jgi:lia operon protein LiaG